MYLSLTLLSPLDTIAGVLGYIGVFCGQVLRTGGGGSGWFLFNPTTMWSILIGVPVGTTLSVLIHVLAWVVPDMLAGSLVARYGAVYLLVFLLTVSRLIFITKFM
jgi:hypothetical protein